MRILSLVLLLFASVASAAPPQRAQLGVVTLNSSALRAGSDAMVAVELKVAPGFHAQSHTPIEVEGFKPIEFGIKMEPNPAVTFGEPQFPAGVVEEYPALGKVSVYAGRIVVRVPVKVKADATPGPIEIRGKLHYQICDASQCYLPEDMPFTVSTQVVPPTAEVTAVHPELFQQAMAPTRGGGQIDASTPNPVPARLFGHDLTSDAYALAFFAAFLVGILFNVMPCVLPVVPLKALGFYEVSQHNRGKSVALGAVFSAGLIATFAAFGLLIFVLHALNWGELFTKTWFVIAIVAVLLVMAASTFGAFTVALPTAAYRFTPRHDTYTGNFLFGILTALLSTPCTFGMFVGLLAWAAKQEPKIGVLLLITVGAGMSFPYFVLSAAPELARRFPRTGPWAELVKQMMGFLLLATAAYFAWGLLDRYLSPRAFWWILFGIIVAAALFLLVRGLQFSKTRVGRAVTVVLAVLMIAPSLYGVRLFTIEPYQWQPYSDKNLADARAAHKIVLIEFTASWCGNCHALEGFVLNNWRVVQSIKSHDVVMLRADVGDDGAPARPLLLKFNAQGSIPLTVIYPPGSDRPIELVGIYSKDDLQNAIEQASKQSVAMR